MLIIWTLHVNLPHNISALKVCDLQVVLECIDLLHKWHHTEMDIIIF